MKPSHVEFKVGHLCIAVEIIGRNIQNNTIWLVHEWEDLFCIPRPNRESKQDLSI